MGTKPCPTGRGNHPSGFSGPHAGPHAGQSDLALLALKDPLTPVSVVTGLTTCGLIHPKMRKPHQCAGGAFFIGRSASAATYSVKTVDAGMGNFGSPSESHTRSARKAIKLSETKMLGSLIATSRSSYRGSTVSVRPTPIDRSWRSWLRLRYRRSASDAVAVPRCGWPCALAAGSSHP